MIVCDLGQDCSCCADKPGSMSVTNAQLISWLAQTRVRLSRCRVERMHHDISNGRVEHPSQASPFPSLLPSTECLTAKRICDETCKIIESVSLSSQP